jgi:hypothetical protein
MLALAAHLSGCGATRENAGIGTAQPSNEAQPAAAAPEPPGNREVEAPAAAEAAAKGEGSAVDSNGTSDPSSVAPSRKAPAQQESLPKSSAGAARAPAKAARSAQDAAPTTDDRDRARPAFAEPPELQRALAEFETQLTTLSTTKSCGDACKALDSMRRSAQQICTLVMDDDPRRRCPTAKERLEQAARDLSARCPSCG